MSWKPMPPITDANFLELLDALAKPDSPWHTLSELDKRKRLDLLSYEQRGAFGRHFAPMIGLTAHLASLTHSLEQQDEAALQAQYEEITKPVTRGA